MASYQSKLAVSLKLLRDHTACFWRIPLSGNCAGPTFHALDVASFEPATGPFAQFVGTLVAREMEHGQEPRPSPGAV